MATGKKAFEGKTSASMIAAILKDEPPAMSSLTPMTPPALDRVVKRCLAKDPENRWQTARDLELELKSIADGGSESALPAASSTGRDRMLRRWAVVAGLVCLILVAIAGFAVLNRKPALPAPVSRFVLPLPSGERFFDLDEQPEVLAVSPDGKHLAYVADTSSARQLHLRSLDSFEVRTIEGTEGASSPFFSPDNQWVGFFAGGKLKKVSIGGGSTVTLCDAPNPGGATWGPNDTIVFSARPTLGLLVVPAEGGTPQQLTTPDSKRGEYAHRKPEFLPGGKAVLFTNQGTDSYGLNAGPIDAPLALYVLKTGERRDLKQMGEGPSYAPSGQLVYAQGGTLMAVPFEVASPVLWGAVPSRHRRASLCGCCAVVRTPLHLPTTDAAVPLAFSSPQ
jgi:serine/threonine-protein kinase